MYCVIQEIETKKVPAGEPKKIEVHESSWSMNGEPYTTYRYEYSQERYERKVRKAYRISIHESFREGSRIRKKQTVICTIGYYDLVDLSWIGDYVRGRWSDKVKAVGIPEEELDKMIYEKLQPLINQVQAEYHQTEEYKAQKEHSRIFKEHRQRVEDFKNKYDAGENDYDQCFDVFGTLRNPDRLNEIEESYRQKQEYERKSQENSRSYYDNSYSNYNQTGSKGFNPMGSQIGEDNKAIFKQFYRTLSKIYHPDSNPGKDTSEEMKALNQLKSDWGV